MDIRTRQEAYEPSNIEIINRASVVFFTGGDQLRITSQLGGTPIYDSLLNLLNRAGTVVGTSAGAACMPQTMLISGPGDESNTINGLGMAPGLNLISEVVIDSHFAERGRIGRLAGAVAQNPRNLGIGIDENTSIIVDKKGCFKVLGAGAIYIVDGSNISYSSLSEKNPSDILSVYGLKLHILSQNDHYDLSVRQALSVPREAQKSNK